MIKEFYLVVGRVEFIPLAHKIKKTFPDAIIYGAGFHEFVDNSLIKTLRHVYLLASQATTPQHNPVIGLLNPGLIVRALAPIITSQDKFTSPPVLCLTSDAKTLIALLGEHHGGQGFALGFAKKMGLSYGGHADKNDDDIGNNATMIKKEFLPAALLANKKIISDWQMVTAQDEPQIVPQCLVAGIGLERNAPLSAVEEALAAALQKINAHPSALHAIASIDIKMDEPALHALAQKIARPCKFFTAQQCAAVPVPNPSSVVEKETGTPSVAEAASLLAAGYSKTIQPTLLLEKQKGSGVTVAISKLAENRSMLDNSISLGHLAVVGIGPGDKNLRSFEATQYILSASDIVGYQIYLDLVSDLTAGKELHQRDLGQETERASLAIDLALSGKQVVLLASGDAGIYALATLVWQVLDERKKKSPDDKKLSSLPITITPGISAFQALAAKLGAPAGNDIAIISLSNIMTPKEKILQRVQGALSGDFPIFLYNPRSKTRQDILLQVIKMAQEKLPPTTAVIIGKNLYRHNEEIIVSNLNKLSIDDIDMFSCVMIANQHMRHYKHVGKDIFYAPRGYQP